MDRFRDAVVLRFGEEMWPTLKTWVPAELQGYGGLLRGTFLEVDDHPLASVRIVVEPWTTDERWAVMVCGRQLGPQEFWRWFSDADLCRVPFMTQEMQCSCGVCGSTACMHGAALTYHWMVRAMERPEFFLLLLNRRGINHRMSINSQPIARVPMSLGTNLDRTRKELLAIVEATVSQALWDRDDLFGGR